MWLQVLLLIGGLALVVMGAEWLVSGASGIARKAGISEFVIGLTIVGFGTSCPELVVSLTGAFEGIADISIGNVLGSNIFNTLLILGLTAVLSPVSMTADNRKKDIPFTLLVTLLFICCGMSKSFFGLGKADMLSRVDGIVFLAVFVLYMIYCFRTGKDDAAGSEDNSEKTRSALASVALVLAGLAGLVIGGRLFVDSAVEIAGALGVSRKFIAVTILAGGTSLPELATCIVAAAKHKDQLALGNILGSNIFNILLILGASAIVTPLSLSGINPVDVIALALSALLIWIFAFTGNRNRIDRWEGVALLAVYAAYMGWLFYSL